VNQDVAENQFGVKQVQDLFDQGAKYRVVFVLDIGQGANLRVFHKPLLPLVVLYSLP
jgi:uncharacterized membrane protein